MKNILSYFKKYKWQLLIGVALIFVQALAQLGLPTLTSELINRGILEQDFNFVLKQGGLMLLVTLINILAVTIVSFISSRVGQGFGRDIRNDIFKKVESFSLNEMDEFSTASLITRTTNDVQQIQMASIMTYRMMLIAPIMAIGGTFLAITKQPKLSTIFLFILPLLLGVIAFVGIKGTPLFRKVQEKVDNLNLVLREKLTGVRVIRAYNKDDYETKRFLKASDDLRSISLDVNFIMALTLPLVTLIMSVTQVAIIWWGSYLVDGDVMMVGDITAFIQYAMQILSSFIMIAAVFIVVPRAMVSAERINEVLITDPEIKDPITPNFIPQTNGDLTFNNVSFKYPDAEEYVLHHLNFTAKRGETTAIIGSTGSGKTTLLNLIPRFYDITNGSITINGVDINETSQDDLRNNIGYIPQKNLLFSGTVAENIRYGKHDASMEEIVAAAKVAQADSFVSELDGGYDAEITQGGTNVSGGQKQRLAIARALVRHPEVYLFDDSFSALDFKTDAKLREALRDEIAQSIFIVVAQRVSSIMEAEQIIVMDEGRIESIGTHDELMRNSAVYQEIAHSQLSEEELA